MRSRVLICIVFMLVSVAAVEAARHIVVPLILAPELDLDGTEQVYVGPIVLEPQGDDPARAVDVSAVREFESFLRRMIRRETRLNLLPAEDNLTVPTDDPLELAGMTEYWKALGERSGAEVIASASIDVAVLDRAGYTTEEYVSPKDGKTYFRQVLVEETGFNYDILLTVFDGKTGEVIHREQITDFKERSERKLQEFTGMFTDLYNLESRLLGVFVPRIIISKRYLYRN